MNSIVNFSMPDLPFSFYQDALPVFVLSVGAILAMLQSVFKTVSGDTPQAVERNAFVFLILCLIAAFGSICYQVQGTVESYFSGAYLAGGVTTLAQSLVLAIALIVTFLMKATRVRKFFFRGEITALFMMTVTGMLVMVSSLDLISLFVGLELSSMGLYALIGYVEPTRQSQEGAFKYFILGAFAAAILLFGFALLYAGTGSLNIHTIIQEIGERHQHPWVQLGALLTLIGLAFKFSLAPFHTWAPDAYEGAPTGLTAFMATSVKVMILVVCLRFFATGMPVMKDVWLPALSFVAILSMIVGNIMALVQSSLKRMLAYSSIAHSGYMAVALASLSLSGVETFSYESILFYLISYSVMTLGAFAILMWLEGDTHNNLQLDDLAGLAKKHPWAAFGLAAFMFSFAGMPPAVGFMAKFFVFNAALKAGLIGLVVIGALGSAISLYYYMRVVVKMYMAEGVSSGGAEFAGGQASFGIGSLKTSYVVTTLAAVSLSAVVLFGTFLPGVMLNWLKEPVRLFLTSMH